MFGSNDILILYTDGVVEAENSEGEPFSANRLPILISSHSQASAQEIVERLYAAIVEFTGSHGVTDDATFLVVKVLGTPDKSSCM